MYFHVEYDFVIARFDSTTIHTEMTKQFYTVLLPKPDNFGHNAWFNR